MLLLSLILACTCTTPAPEAPTPDEVAAPAPEPISDEILYAFSLQLQDGRVLGLRVFTDGRLQERTLSGNSWTPPERITPAALQDLRGRLANPSIARLPDVLPVPPDTREDAPRASWVVRTPEGLRSITAERFAGFKVPALEGVYEALAEARGMKDVRTHWTYLPPGAALDATPIEADVPCTPLRTDRLRQLTADLLDTAGTTPAEETKAPLLVRIAWQERALGWTTTAHLDGVVEHLGLDGAIERVRLPESRLSRVLEALARVDFSDGPALCGRLASAPEPKPGDANATDAPGDEATTPAPADGAEGPGER